MPINYEFVDQEGDKIDTKIFRPHISIPVELIEVRIGETPDDLTFVIRYDHSKPITFLSAPAGKANT